MPYHNDNRKDTEAPAGIRDSSTYRHGEKRVEGIDENIGNICRHNEEQGRHGGVKIPNKE